MRDTTLVVFKKLLFTVTFQIDCKENEWLLLRGIDWTYVYRDGHSSREQTEL